MSDADTYHESIVDWVESIAGVDASSKAKGDAFCRWCLENIFDQPSDDALDAMEVSGAYDYGIDAFIRPKDEDEPLIVIQAKYESAHEWQEITAFLDNMVRIREYEVNISELSATAKHIVAQIQDAYDQRRKVNFYYLTSKTFTRTEKSRLAKYEPDFFIYDIKEIVQNLQNKQPKMSDRIDGVWFSLRFTGEKTLILDRTVVIAARLTDMYDFASEGGDELFDSNVRQYLNKTKINKGIQETIDKKPQQFWLYNNGITIVCDDFKEEDHSLSIKTPQIVNGCQTMKSITNYLGSKREVERSLITGHVLVKVIKGADAKEKREITLFTNKQNAVRGKDFLSLEDFHKKLQRKFARLNYYYEIQRGAWAALGKRDRDRYTGMESLSYLSGERFKNVLPALETIQAFVAGYKGRPGDAMGRPNELVPGEDLYAEIITNDLSPDEPEQFLYPCLIRKWALNNGYGRNSNKPWRAYGAWFFVHAYYVLAVKVFAHLYPNDVSQESPEKIPTQIWQKLFASQVLNIELLKTTDKPLMAQYFGDSQIRDLDVRKLLRSQADLDLKGHRDILDDAAKEIASEDLVQKFAEFF